ncbi:MAG: FAD-binding dehydrogenase, partial [Ktedonobacteraceae bacterium]|nr:FAD-binding dehydrogenase [Ktedonobacteraceae bacterium]
AAPDDAQPALTLRWQQPQRIGRIELSFDADFDHAMESVLFTHPESVMPFCVKHYRLVDGNGELLAECMDNHQTRNSIRLARPVTTKQLTLQVLATQGDAPAAVFGIRCYEE